MSPPLAWQPDARVRPLQSEVFHSIDQLLPLRMMVVKYGISSSIEQGSLGMLLSRMQGLIQIGDDIVRMFRTHTEPHHVRRNLRQSPAFLPLLLMS